MLKPKQFSFIMNSQLSTLLPTILTHFLLILSYNVTITVGQQKNTSIGVIINVDSRFGKEVRAAMEVAIQISNKNSTDRLFSLRYRNPGNNPLQAAYAADELIQKEKVPAIVGMETLQQTTLVADVGNKAPVPVLSLAPTAIPSPLAQSQWPFLVQTASNLTEQMKFIAAVIHFFKWQRFIVIYEVDRYGSDTGTFAALAEKLQNVSSQIEHQLVLPPATSISDPKRLVRQELAKVRGKSPRVFIVLQLSLSLATHLFKEAKQMGLMGKDSAWIVTDIIASQLDSVNTSVISSMEGVVGIKYYFREDDYQPFINFRRQFKQIFGSEYPEEDNSEPGIHALRAFDSISSITNAINGLGGNISSPSLLLESILSSNFTGLSGSIGFQSGQPHVFTVVNVIGKSYQEVGFWSSKFGFSADLVTNWSFVDGGDNKMDVLAEKVSWPGHLKSSPKGWVMPSDENKMKIGVPGSPSFDKFVRAESTTDYNGYCIAVFQEVLKIVEQRYPLPYEFHPYNGTYDELVNQVINKTFDAVIGDVTILAKRLKNVEFTQPFQESCLTMIVTEKPESGKAWMFLKPFTKGMWAATGAILIYTVCIVWLLERQSNPEFEGPWKNQLGTAFWFTSTSLFFAQRERVHSSYTRVVVVVWLFVVLALNSSYTASLSSMLTVSRLVPNVTDVEWLKRNNAKIGCNKNSFIGKYLVDVMKFKDENIKKISYGALYPTEFESRNITAAFLELPYKKAFLQDHCQGYTGIDLPDRFGGFGFVFQKGSPIASDFSEAILSLSENGKLKELENDWFSPSAECLASQTSSKTDSLSWESFWGLYLFSGIISTLCYILFSIHRCADQSRRRGRYGSDSTNEDNSWNYKLVKFLSFLQKGKTKEQAGGSPSVNDEEEAAAPEVEFGPLRSESMGSSNSSTADDQIERQESI